MKISQIKITLLCIFFLSTVLSPFRLLADEVEDMVEEFCKCTTESNANLSIVVQKVKSGDVAGANKLLEEMEPKMKEMEKCTEEVSKKFSTTTMSADQKTKAQDIILKKCPTPSLDGLDKTSNP